ncbi:MFS transporter [Methanosphaera sp. WGK6]|uniref:MFS transporter n=1 Tax=Methanosphaera sp. WGK6 TaxID=1561964 RepID=UPI00084C5732|nr:MFS transporter [Methanosphaera sp. WGK6]OED29822.1 major facilitator transporter [Methanosphaera sp. WGK6]
MNNEEKINRNVILIGVIASFIVSFITNGISVALPTIATNFHISNITQNWIITIYLLTISMASIPLGKICGKIGLKKSMTYGIIFFIVGSILAGLSLNVYFMMISMIIMGIGSSIQFINILALTTKQIPSNERGKALGYGVTGGYLGLTLAPTIAGILIQNISWRSVFFITIPFLLIVYHLLISIDKEYYMQKERPIDIKGSFLYLIGIVLLLYGFTILNELRGFFFVVGGIIFLLIFAKFELKISNPIYDMRLFNNHTYTASSIASWISYFATFVVTYVLNYHFQYLQGLTPQTTGIILIVRPLFVAIVSPYAGRLSDKYDPHILTAIGMFIVSTALIILCFLNQSTPLYMIIISIALQGIGFGLFTTPNNSMVLGSIDSEEIGTASASITTLRTIGQAFSVALLSLIFAIIMGNVAITPSNYPLLVESNQITMIISTILCVIAILLSLIGMKFKDNLN